MRRKYRSNFQLKLDVLRKLAEQNPILLPYTKKRVTIIYALVTSLGINDKTLKPILEAFERDSLVLREKKGYRITTTGFLFLNDISWLKTKYPATFEDIYV